MKYTIWITIIIRHSFFNAEYAGLELKETDKTALLLKRAGMLFRKQGPCKWILLKPEAETDKVNTSDLILKETNSTLKFHLIINNPDFYYFTDWKTDAKYIGADFKTVIQPNNSILEISPAPARNIRITLQSRPVRWEYILIPKYNDNAYPIELIETHDKLQFSPPEPVSFPGENKAYRSVTSSSIPMREIYNYKIGLWEKRENGKRLLNQPMPYPKTSSLSIFEPKEMITSYFYF